MIPARGRPRTGSAYERHGVIVVAVNLRPGSRSDRKSVV